MMDIAPFLKSLLSAAGIPGYETPVAELIQQTWRPLADEIHTTRLGSLHALHKGNLPEPRPALMLSAHMDSIGMLVAGFEEGFIRLTSNGTLDPRLLPGQLVRVHGRQDLQGVIATRPAGLMPDHRRNDAAGFEDLLVDVGLPARRVAQLVEVGNPVSFANDPVPLGEGILSGHSLDNRASIAALTMVLAALQERNHAWDVWFTATTQEETSYAGGVTSAFSIQPGLAVVLDVTYAQAPGAHSWEYFPLGGGPTLGIGPHVHPYLMKKLRALAESMQLPFSIEPMPESSLTEAEMIQLSAAGIPTAIVSIPIRYMHTPVEVVALSDIQRAAELMTEFVDTLDAGFLYRMGWDD